MIKAKSPNRVSSLSHYTHCLPSSSPSFLASKISLIPSGGCQSHQCMSPDTLLQVCNSKGNKGGNMTQHMAEGTCNLLFCFLQVPPSLLCHMYFIRRKLPFLGWSSGSLSNWLIFLGFGLFSWRHRPDTGTFLIISSISSFSSSFLLLPFPLHHFSYSFFFLYLSILLVLALSSLSKG